MTNFMFDKFIKTLPSPKRKKVKRASEFLTVNSHGCVLKIVLKIV